MAVSSLYFNPSSPVARVGLRHMRLTFLATHVFRRLKELQEWDTLLVNDPLAWAERSRDPELLLVAAIQSDQILEQCRQWLLSHGWH